MSLTYEDTNKPIAYDLASERVLYYTEQDKNIYEAFGKFEVIPSIDKGFEFVYAFGQSGSGKSYWTSEYALSYRRIYPKNNIFLITQKPSDPAFDDKSILKIRRVQIDDDFMDREIDITTDFKNCLIIFDDFMGFPNKKVTEKICNMVVQVLTLGRCNHIFSVITSHLLYTTNNSSLYMHIQNEIHRMVFFKGVNMFQLNYCLTNYWGFTKRQINYITSMDSESRWICVNKLPSYILSNFKCILLHTKFKF